MQMIQVAKVSQMTAILLERARKQGVLEEAILASMDTNDIAVFEKAVDTHYNYDAFFTYAEEQGEDLRTAIQEGYKMKYNTQGGLFAILDNRFGLLPNKDYVAELGRLTKIPLLTADAKYLHGILAGNWVMLVSTDGEAFKLADEFFADVIAADGQKVTVNLIFISEYQKDIEGK
jgi:hypothetical protein